MRCGLNRSFTQTPSKYRQAGWQTGTQTVAVAVGRTAATTTKEWVDRTGPNRSNSNANFFTGSERPCERVGWVFESSGGASRVCFGLFTLRGHAETLLRIDDADDDDDGVSVANVVGFALLCCVYYTFFSSLVVVLCAHTFGFCNYFRTRRTMTPWFECKIIPWHRADL